MEEGYDLNHMANAGKYISAMIAAAARMKYAITPTPLWLAAVVITSTLATFYQLYWDFVKDWGFFTPGSKNAFLRDDLVLKNKSIYYVSIVSAGALFSPVPPLQYVSYLRALSRLLDQCRL